MVYMIWKLEMREPELSARQVYNIIHKIIKRHKEVQCDILVKKGVYIVKFFDLGNRFYSVPIEMSRDSEEINYYVNRAIEDYIHGAENKYKFCSWDMDI